MICAWQCSIEEKSIFVLDKNQKGIIKNIKSAYEKYGYIYELLTPYQTKDFK